MNIRKTFKKYSFMKSTCRILIFALCASILIASLFLFIVDKGNIICYANEQFNSWQNPSYQEMISFIETDLTNLKTYSPTYDCSDFTIDFIKNARNNGIRAGYVILRNPIGNDHAISCFHTKDKGLYFVEPQTDCVFSLIEMNEMIKDMQYHPVPPNNQKTINQPLSDFSISWYMII